MLFARPVLRPRNVDMVLLAQDVALYRGKRLGDSISVPVAMVKGFGLSAQ